MNKTIYLFLGSAARFSDGEPFFVVENDGLNLEFKSNFYDLSKAYINLQNGKLKRSMKLTFPFTVPQEFLFAGKLRISVDLYFDGSVAKHWNCAPILIKEINGETVAFDELIMLEKRTADLETKVVKLIETLNNYGEVINKINEIAAKQNELAETVSSIKENY